jgi:predicted ATPase
MYWTSNIVEGMDEMHKIWGLLSSDTTETEFSYLLHNFLWNRLMKRGNAEQIIAKIEFGIEFEKLGSKLPSGIGNLLCLLDSALSAAEGTILFIDEPEISLHIDWQAKIVDAMWKLGSRNHIVFTTHSPEIVMTNLEKVITIPPLRLCD